MEKQTQSTLNSFHSAGLTIKTVVTGVPRFSELMATSKDPKGVCGKLYLNKKFDDIHDVKKYIGNSLVEIYFKELVESYKFFGQPKCKTWYILYNKMKQENINLNRKMISFKLNKNVVYKNRLDLKIIKKSIEKKYKDLQVVYSPDNLLEIDIFFKDDKKLTLDENIQYINEENKWFIYIEDVVIPNLNSILICGIKGIKDYIINKENGEYCIDTEGVNLIDLIKNPCIDFSRTISNNMWDNYNIFGIEACRQFLIDEFQKVLNNDGTHINHRHITLLVDTMTYSGIISSISRHGIKGRVSPMARASFEESLDNFIKAGVFGEREHTKSVSSSIMLGKNTRIGTGVVDLIYEESSDGMMEI